MVQCSRCRSDGVVDDGGDDVTELAAVKAAKVGLPAAPALSLDRLGFRMWERVLAARPTSLCVPRPLHPFYFSAVQRGPTNH